MLFIYIFIIMIVINICIIFKFKIRGISMWFCWVRDFVVFGDFELLGFFLKGFCEEIKIVFLRGLFIFLIILLKGCVFLRLEVVDDFIGLKLEFI